MFLKTPNERRPAVITRHLRKIQELSITASIKCTFLQIPYYSIQRWNETKGHQNPVIYKADDEQLTSLIDTANEFVELLNSETNTHTPKLNQDLVRSRKKKGGKQRYSLNFNLLHDGIHPGENIARSWLASISRQIHKDCV